MAHLRELGRQCQYGDGCLREAKVGLFSVRNEPMGVYCRAHGGRRKLEADLSEERARRAAEQRAADGRRTALPPVDVDDWNKG